MKILFFILLLTLGCNIIPCSFSSDLTEINDLPNKDQIAGIYKPDSFTKNDFKEFAHSDNIMLILQANGKIQLKNFPKMVFLMPGDSSNFVLSGSGNWSFDFAKTAKIKTQIEFDQKIQIEIEPFELFRKDDKYYILIPFGDPDACYAVRLVQQ